MFIMLTDKELKNRFKKMASAEPDKYYATGVLKNEGCMSESKLMDGWAK